MTTISNVVLEVFYLVKMHHSFRRSFLPQFSDHHHSLKHCSSKPCTQSWTLYRHCLSWVAFAFNFLKVPAVYLWRRPWYRGHCNSVKCWKQFFFLIKQDYSFRTPSLKTIQLWQWCFSSVLSKIWKRIMLFEMNYSLYTTGPSSTAQSLKSQDNGSTILDPHYLNFGFVFVECISELVSILSEVCRDAKEILHLKSSSYILWLSHSTLYSTK